MNSGHSLGVIFSNDYLRLNFGPSHPFQPLRFIKIIDILKEHIQFDLIDPKKIDPHILVDLNIHSQEYIEIVKKCSNLKLEYLSKYSFDTPCFKGIYEWALLYCGGAIAGCDLLLENAYQVVFNTVGGLHHAKYDEDGGFCVFNDCALALAYLFEKKQKVAYLDIDAHAGDGTYLILYDKPILKISIHEDPRFLYPGRGFIHEVGENEGYGYTLNIPMPPGSGDENFINVIRQLVVPILKKFNPDFLIIQCGVDGFYLDPLSHLNYTHHGFLEFAKIIRKLKKSILLCSGGGYSKYVHYLHLIILGTLSYQDEKIEKIIQHLDNILPKKDQKTKDIENIIKKIQKNHPVFDILNI
ncbi:MAG: acetoin utilization protein AcuC [Candidatus Njordarchaeota archaeon]